MTTVLPAHVERLIDRSSGCWLYTGKLRPNGYARVKVGGKMIFLHRLAYSAYKGDFPAKLDLDHLCRVRHCCNPDHLEPVTRKVNVERGLLGQRSRETTHCPARHRYDEQNTYTTSRGGRQCRACTRARSKTTYQRRRAAA